MYYRSNFLALPKTKATETVRIARHRM